MHHDRREFLRRVAALPFAATALSGTRALAQQSGLIIRQKEPENLEFPFSALDSYLTPTERFFIRSHFAVPKLDAKAWRLKVEGAVERPLELTYDELLKLPSRTQPALLECAGNGRVFLVPQVRGLQWELGAVGNAEWTGVPLAAVLEKAGVRSGAVEVVLEGADRGEVRDEPKPAGVIPFARSLPVDRARQPEVLLAHQMNGTALSPSHGYPVRAVVPGWYGMASVKWLTRIIVIDRPFLGFFQSFDYTYWQRREDGPVVVPVTELQVKAQVARPAMHEVVRAGTAYRMHGAAWTGDSEVTKVEVSTDGGKTWSEAKLLDKPVRYAWRRWEHKLRSPDQPGRYTVMVRATDQRGQAQPAQRDPDRRSYMISHLLPIEVEVR
jgi:DMSO/TMAO reductase YedYZ molybdopterin-dependent catalytic subunit